MSIFTRQKWIFLLAAVLLIASPGVSYAQLDLKAKAVETLTNGVMKELEKKFTETVSKEAISAAAKANVVNKLSEMSRPIVKNFIDSATSGKLPNQAELVNKVMKDILPRVPELVAASAMEGDGLAAAGVVGSTAQVAGQAPTAGQIQSAVSAAQLQNNYDDEKDFTVETINEGTAVRITRYNGKSTELKIPPRIGDRPVTEIGERVFMKKGLTSVVIPESVTFIGNMAFADNKIGSVSIGANVYIADNAFENSQYNPFSVAFYNSQGRKAGTYGNSWRLITAAAPQSARPATGSTASAGTTSSTAPASTASADANEVISSTSGWTASHDKTSISNVSVDKEQIDGRDWDVLVIDVSIKTNGWSGASLNNVNVSQRLQNADGVRFKALGDGRKWRVIIGTSNVKDDAYHGATISTQEGKVISFDVPFSKLTQPSWKSMSVKFNKSNIYFMKIERSNDTGDKKTGPAVIKVFDFEIY